MHILAKIAVTTALPLALAGSVMATGPKKELHDWNPKAGERPGLMKKVADFIGNHFLATCSVITKSGTSFTCKVSKDGSDQTYTIQTDEKTKFRPPFPWGNNTLHLADIKVNDVVNVFGKWSDDGHTSVRAQLVRDTSIQTRIAIKFGKVLNLTSDGWVMKTEKNGDQKVVVEADTKFVSNSEKTVSKSDVKVDSKVRVRGLWDVVNKTFTDVKQVKIFDESQQDEHDKDTKPTVTTTLTPTLTVTLTP